jgi:anhydro-N-acetylmuramic acid kinase
VRVAGIMSGTSLDGIDVAIVDIHGQRIKTVAFHHVPYAAAVRESILGVSNRATHTAEIARLHFLLGRLYAEAVRAACRRHHVRLESIELIGCHGQTIYHQGRPAKFLGRPVAATLQLGEAGMIAELTGIPVVSDFRTGDIAAGGQGAPLVPYVDCLLFRHARRGRVALNIGGIANITVLPPHAQRQPVIAFDTGPGNMVMDALTAEYTRGRQSYDRDGRIAARGKIDRALLDRLLADPYYRRRPPKTAGREQYGQNFVAAMKASGRSLPDLIATATALTAAAIAQAIQRFVIPRMPVDAVIASGGGVHNRQLMGYLQAFLPGIPLVTSGRYGVDPDAKEAIAFAVLARETMRGCAANVPSATGARHPVVLGKITPRSGQRSSKGD